MSQVQERRYWRRVLCIIPGGENFDSNERRGCWHLHVPRAMLPQLWIQIGGLTNNRLLGYRASRCIFPRRANRNIYVICCFSMDVHKDELHQKLIDRGFGEYIHHYTDIREYRGQGEEASTIEQEYDIHDISMEIVNGAEEFELVE